jgi:hypothetical protein
VCVCVCVYIYIYELNIYIYIYIVNLVSKQQAIKMVNNNNVIQ